MVSPLDWGLGHATRLIPIIDYLISRNFNVTLCGSGKSLDLLKNKYPNLLCENLPSPAIRYGKKTSMGLKFFIDFLKLIANLKKERKIVSRLIRKHNIDTIISDNRPGVFSKDIKSIYITHQLNIYPFRRNGLFSKISGKTHGKIISEYSFCLIPDIEGKDTLAGKLSAKKYQNTINIGPLSRFTNLVNTKIAEDKNEYSFICILSGPEPQRTIFEKELIDIFTKAKHKVLIIRGILNDQNINNLSSNIKIINTCQDSEMYNYLKSDSIIICRSGYSSLMDLAVVGKSAVLVPTPGQPEQEYLADYYKEIFNFEVCYQRDLKKLELDKLKVKSFTFEFNPTQVQTVLSEIL